MQFHAAKKLNRPKRLKRDVDVQKRKHKQRHNPACFDLGLPQASELSSMPACAKLRELLAIDDIRIIDQYIGGQRRFGHLISNKFAL